MYIYCVQYRQYIHYTVTFHTLESNYQVMHFCEIANHCMAASTCTVKNWKIFKFNKYPMLLMGLSESYISLKQQYLTFLPPAPLNIHWNFNFTLIFFLQCVWSWCLCNGCTFRPSSMTPLSYPLPPTPPPSRGNVAIFPMFRLLSSLIKISQGVHGTQWPAIASNCWLNLYVAGSWW